jgi:hypothetical protein
VTANFRPWTYAALDQHWRYADAGQRQTERLQVTRALFERLSLDLRSVVFRPDIQGGRGVGIVGDAQELIVYFDAPSGEKPIGPQSVRWEMQTLEVKLRDASTRGLARIDDVTESAEDEQASPPDVFAAEVETIRFRFFARGSWFDDWDSAEQQELPQAVEITIGFRAATAKPPKTSGEPKLGEYRLVVPVPASEA